MRTTLQELINRSAQLSVIETKDRTELIIVNKIKLLNERLNQNKTLLEKRMKLNNVKYNKELDNYALELEKLEIMLERVQDRTNEKRLKERVTRVLD